MRIDTIHLNHNKFVNDYRNQTDKLKAYFEYNPFMSYKKRLTYLEKSNYQREELASILEKMNNNWGSDDTTLKNIERLKSDNAVVVIGGQQAGLLTGPLYSVNKVISIIQLAKEQEAELNRPVIPVFWIAGEDHDFDEINHVNMRTETGLKKRTIQQIPKFKKSVSQIDLDSNLTKEWLTDIFLELEESTHSKIIYEELLNILNESKTYVDFFARLINKLFPESGLVLVDSADASLRSIESKYFIKLIEHQESIAKTVSKTIKSLQEQDYSISLEAEENEGHLFYHEDHGERILLSRTESGMWQGKSNHIEFTSDALIQIAEKTPNRLSNNVVTRPLMQEWLFPTLAFVGGYGEISYWASLKKVFKELDLEMPPVVPRYSITYIPKKLNEVLNKKDIDISQAINHGVSDLKLNWLSNQSTPPVELLIDEMNKGIEALHQPIQKVASNLGEDLQHLAETNLAKIIKTTEFLEKRLLREEKYKYKKEINDYDLITDYLCPDNGLQERIFNPLFLINNYGFDFIKEITETPLSFKKDHFVIYL